MVPVDRRLIKFGARGRINRRHNYPLLSHLGKQAVDSFRSFEEALVTEDQEYDVIALPEQRRWQPVPRD